MSRLFENLNKKQLEAVLYDDGPLAIIAGAGSGKTKTITHKIAYLIEEKGIDPRKILAVTFTNKASQEMKERVKNIIGDNGEYVWMSTYHSLCAKILRRDIDKIGINRNFNIIDTLDQKQILKRAYKKFNLSYRTITFKTVIDYISSQKNSNNQPSELLEMAAKDIDKVMVNLYQFYLDETRKSNSLDFDDLLILTHELFTNNHDVASKWSGLFDYVLVDEFQDTSIVQYEIIKKIAKNKKIIVVGDPDQTIYTWRHADPSLIMNFQTNFRNSHQILLEQNYRSSDVILKAANKLITHNKNRIAKNLFTVRTGGNKISYHHGFSEDSSAKWVAAKIKELIIKRVPLNNIAILYRSNYLTNSLEKALIKENISYLIYGGVKFYQREEIKDVISYLKIINNNDNISLRRMINVPARKIGATTQERLFSFLSEKGPNLYEAIINNFGALPLSNLPLENLTHFINLIRKYKAALKSNTVSSVVEKFLIEIKYFDKWSSFEDQGRRENIMELITNIKKWEAGNAEKSLGEFLEEISLYTDQDQIESTASGYVSLMTIHTSKGLEYENVFVFGVSESVFPAKRSLLEGGQEALEEERRLAYVAVTRAKDRLYLTSSKGYSVDYQSQKSPSRFLKELGIDVQKESNVYIAPKKFDDNYIENDFLEGEKIAHETFGNGVVVRVQGKIIEVAFKSPHGVKTMMKNHKSLRKVEQ